MFSLPGQDVWRLFDHVCAEKLLLSCAMRMGEFE
jgi:hypothetical protein